MQTELPAIQTHRAEAPHDLVERLLRFPLFYKVLIANSLLVALGALAGTAISIRFAGKWSEGAALALMFTIIGVALTIILNTLILRAALAPLRDLRVTVDALACGDLSARVPESPLADSDLASVSDMLNQILDHLRRYQASVQDLSGGIMRAQEGERRRIARELHDQIGQSLTLLLVRLKIIEATPAAAAVRGELADLRAAVAGTIDQVRRLALDLRPPALYQLGLVPALRELTRDYSDRVRVAVTLDAPNEPLALEPERATAIYRIVQEALTNIAKHADAKAVRVSLAMRRQTIQLSIRDDGHGFDAGDMRHAQERDEGPGLGLFGMEERARLLGGTLKIATRPGAGTVILAAIPLHPMEQPHGTADLDDFADTGASHLDLVGG